MERPTGTQIIPKNNEPEESDVTGIDSDWVQEKPHGKLWPKALAGFLFLVVVAGGAYYWFALRSTEATVPVTTVKVTQGDISVTVDGDGQVEPAQALDLTLQQGGAVSGVLVEIGDAVKAGDPLVQLDTTTLETDVKTAEANLKSARAQLDALSTGASSADVAAAQAALNANLLKLNKVEAGPETSNVTSAQAQLDAAKAALQDLKDGPTAAELSSAEAKCAQAESNLDQTKNNMATQKEQARLAWESSANDVRTAQTNLNAAYQDFWFASTTWTDPTTKRPINDAQVAAYKLKYDTAVLSEKNAESAMAQKQLSYESAKQEEIQQINSAQSELDDAKTQLAALTSGPAESELASAEAAVEQAQAAVDNISEGYTQADVASAASSVAQSQASLATLTEPPPASDLASAEANVVKAQADLEAAQQALAEATLTAPFDGVITGVSVIPGAIVSSGSTAASIEDQSSMHVDLSLSETDLANIKMGQQAAVTFDALPGQTVTGAVASIAPTATIDQNVATYLVQVKLDSKGVPVKTGMSATASIVTESRQGVMEVPTRALVTVGQSKTLQVIDQASAEPVTMVVKTGLADSSMTEIVSVVSPAGEKINAGDAVVIRVSTTTTQTTTPNNQGPVRMFDAGGGMPPDGGGAPPSGSSSKSSR